MKKEEEKE